MLRPVTRLSFLALTAVSYVASFPKWNLFVLGWIALGPLLSCVQVSSSDRDAFIQGWLAGLLSYSGLLYWILVTFRAAHLSWTLAGLALAALAGYLALFWGCWTLLAYRWRDEPAPIYALLVAAAWVALEWARSYLFSGFPWTLLADSQALHPTVIQIASVTGAYGVSFLMVFFSASLSSLLLHRTFSLQTFVGCSLVLIVVLGFGRYRLSCAPLQEPADLRVALLQGSIDQYKKWDQAYVSEIKDAYERLVSEARTEKPGLVIWPETSVPGYLLQDPPLRAWLNQTILKTEALHVVGAPAYHDRFAYNSAFLMDRSGQVMGEYTKQHLVPFGETVPFSSVLGRWIKVLNELGGFASKEGPGLLPFPNHPLGVNICYEAIFPNLVRKSVQAGAQAIVNITNDGWYMKTSAPYQHFAPNVLRAVENGRWLVRADNTGVSAIVDPWGRIQAASPIYVPMVVSGTIAFRTELTPYTRLGDVFAMLCVVFLVGFVALQRLSPRRSA